MAKKWLPVPGFIGFVTLIAGFLIQEYVLLLSKWNSITWYPVIFNFLVRMGRVLEKKFRTGRVPGSHQTLLACWRRWQLADFGLDLDAYDLHVKGAVLARDCRRSCSCWFTCSRTSLDPGQAKPVGVKGAWVWAVHYKYQFMDLIALREASKKHPASFLDQLSAFV